MNKTAVDSGSKTIDETLLGSWGKELNLTVRDSQVGYLTLNVPGRANTLTSEIIDYMDHAIELASRSDLKGLVFASGKHDIFLAGADIKEILAVREESVTRNLAERGHTVFKKILALPFPTVSAIHGICLGGGLEFVLCSDGRLATSAPHTLIGLPEVNIGLIPGLGGTQRLTARVGLKSALDFILSGEPKGAEECLSIGLIDEIVEDENKLLDRAEEMVLSMAARDFDRRKLREERARAMEEADGGEKKRQMLLKTSERVIRIRTGGHYPAPKLVLEVIRIGLEQGEEKGLAAEIDGFAKMAVSNIARNMINVYFTREMAAQTAQRALEKSAPVTELGIMGSGVMGKGIAETAINAGLSVVIRGSSDEKTEAEAERLSKKLHEGSDASVTAAGDLARMSKADIILESVNEDLKLKKELIQKLELTESNILATNTSSFSIAEIAAFSNRPENILGLHFFSPVDRMPLVEVITHEGTDAGVQRRATGLIGRLGKVPIVVKDSPGFLVNRLLCIFLLEASRMLDEKVPLNWIDSVSTKFGMPMGAFELCDELGWGLITSVARLLHEKFGERMLPPAVMDRAMTMGIDGKKTNAGCYLWEDSNRKLSINQDFIEKADVRTSDEPVEEAKALEIQDRLILPMIDEAARCLEEKVVRKARDIDLAIIIGAGFPPFRGGLLRYADELGIDYVVQGLERIYANHEPKRSVSSMLLEMQQAGRKFYSLS
ncbi:MAG: enoyl-CoA hydratase/isomerase family protein [Cyanobacteria bacterium HKST-UBA02]|nr:enoyl-CoA hydratase/isomerase family protein [Cyanobacteria bacterium HKST-UBA02]